MGRGGWRPGSGPKPKSDLEHAVSGDAGHRGRVLAPVFAAGTGVAPVETFDAPDGLTVDELRVWVDLAPHAFHNRTLTRATAYSFALLCRNIVIERELALSPDERGKANHRGVMQRIDAELLRFSLSPCGKPILEAAAVPEPQAKASYW